MSQVLSSSLLLLVTLLAGCRGAALVEAAQALDQTYANPIGIDLADPFVLRHEGVYYLYATSARDGYRVWTSPNLREWRERGMCFTRGEDSWGRHNFWAPEVIEHNGRFYLFYSARGETGELQQHLRICVASSDSPLGPFQDEKAPLWDPGFSVIDASPFIDADGTPYLFYVRDISQSPTSSIYVVQLSHDLLNVVGDASLCMRPDQPWEGGEWNEAPHILRHVRRDGKPVYLLTYSANGFFDPKYAVGYAIAEHPTGPWTKAEENPVLAGGETPGGIVSGPGHGAFIRSPDGRELFYVYHVHQEPTGGPARELAIDRARIEEDDAGNVRLRILGPTRQPQPLPSGSR